MSSVFTENNAAPETPTKETPASRMGRPTDPLKEQAILAAAQRAFLEMPYDKVSMGHIANQANVSKVTLYAKYGSKDGLFVKALSSGCDGIYETARLEAQTGAPIRETLARFGTDFVMNILSPEVSAMHGIMMQIRHQKPDLTHRYYKSVVVNSTQMIVEALKIAVERGELKCANLQCAATQYIAMVQGEFRYRLELGIEESPSKEDVETYVVACADLFVRGYGV